MASAVTYQFYSETYGGGLSEAAFGLVLPAAERHVRWLCGGRTPCRCEVTPYKRAICAACDAFAEFGEGQVGGFALGDFKVTHYEDADNERVVTRAAIKELVGTPCIFCGVR